MRCVAATAKRACRTSNHRRKSDDDLGRAGDSVLPDRRATVGPGGARARQRRARGDRQHAARARGGARAGARAGGAGARRSARRVAAPRQPRRGGGRVQRGAVGAVRAGRGGGRAVRPGLDGAGRVLRADARRVRATGYATGRARGRVHRGPADLRRERAALPAGADDERGGGAPRAGGRRARAAALRVPDLVGQRDLAGRVRAARPLRRGAVHRPRRHRVLPARAGATCRCTWCRRWC
ncbi:putative rhamnosyltransferase 2 [Burkholderia pseudomallei]|nr:putative rhamnosyltransferase 2 [Burkholderia pseudomallei]